MKKEMQKILTENRKRREALEGAVRTDIPMNGGISPKRCQEDFEYWAARAVTIRDKRSGKYIPFVLNRAQRRVLKEMEWMRAESGESDKMPIFVPWYEIEMYTLEVSDPEALWYSMSDYERDLWEKHGCTLEQINWYRQKKSEYPKEELMHAEFPTTPHEAFVSSDANVFMNEDIEELRKDCETPMRGEMNPRGQFIETPKGCLELWELPRDEEDYIVAVDIGGRSARADWSVIAVLKAGKKPEVVAQWRGHTDHDILASKAMRIAESYNEALLVIESNTLETADDSSSSSWVLERVAKLYSNTYRRSRHVGGPNSSRGIGFHTNHQTKGLVINTLTAAVRDKSYIERDHKACNEYATYCQLPNGSYEARQGTHDDILMTRAIALYILETNDYFTSEDPIEPVNCPGEW